jgi:hypothetical protein
MTNNYTYVIANITELNNVDYSQVLQTSTASVRKNIAQTKFILKYDGSKPPTIQTLDTNGKLYTYSGNKYFTHPQILTIISDVEWTGTQSMPF